MFDSTESLEQAGGRSEPSEVEGDEAVSSQQENSGGNEEDSQPPEQPHISVTVNGQDEPDVAHLSNNDPPPSLPASNGDTSATADGQLESTNKENQSNVSGIFINCSCFTCEHQKLKYYSSIKLFGPSWVLR